MEKAHVFREEGGQFRRGSLADPLTQEQKPAFQPGTEQDVHQNHRYQCHHGHIDHGHGSDTHIHRSQTGNKAGQGGNQSVGVSAILGDPGDDLGGIFLQGPHGQPQGSVNQLVLQVPGYHGLGIEGRDPGQDLEQKHRKHQKNVVGYYTRLLNVAKLHFRKVWNVHQGNLGGDNAQNGLQNVQVPGNTDTGKEAECPAEHTLTRFLFHSVASCPISACRNRLEEATSATAPSAST